MAGSFPTGGFGLGNHAEGMWQAMEQLKSTFEKRVGTPNCEVDEPRPCATVNGPSTILSESMLKTYPRGVVLGRP